ETGHVIASGFRQGRLLVFAQVQSHGYARPAARGSYFFQAASDFLRADIGKSESVNQALLGGKPEDARARISRLRSRRDGAQFHETKAEPRPDGDALGIFIKARGESDRIGEGQ